MKVSFIVSGRVQHVGYRYFVITKARIVGVKGLIRNLTNGSVEIFFDGAKENIELMYNLCLKGPAFARVDSIEVNYDIEFPLNTTAYYDF